jgi:Mn-dependent DtxR family transcriptional regulator
VIARRTPSMPTRYHGLARLAWSRIQTGHDPVEVITQAIVAAVEPGAGLPPCFDRLTPAQREVVLVLHGAGPVRLAAIASALGISRVAALGRARDLAEAGVVERVGFGEYQLAARQIALRARPGCYEIREQLLRFIAHRGRVTLREAAAHFGVHPWTMTKRLRALRRRGEVADPAKGVYTIASTEACAP